MILIEAKRIANSDGGTLYMMTEDQRLRFEIMMTDSLNFHMGGTSGKDIPFYPVKLYMDEGEPNKTMIAAYVGLSRGKKKKAGLVGAGCWPGGFLDGPP